MKTILIPRGQYHSPIFEYSLNIQKIYTSAMNKLFAPEENEPMEDPARLLSVRVNKEIPTLSSVILGQVFSPNLHLTLCKEFIPAITHYLQGK